MMFFDVLSLGKHGLAVHLCFQDNMMSIRVAPQWIMSHCIKRKPCSFSVSWGIMLSSQEFQVHTINKELDMIVQEKEPMYAQQALGQRRFG